MDTPAHYLPALQRFLRESAFAERGAVMTDLDGTAVHEVEGRVLLSRTMELGLKRVHERGREVLINTLRFPLSVMRVFGAEWRRATGADVAAVTLKGSLVGRVVQAASGELGFEEIAAFPLEPAELQELLQGVRGMVAQGVQELLVFFYPRDWRCGERIWTPDPARVDAVAAKYRSASRVFSGPVQALEAELLRQPQCMVFLLVDAPQDRLMAYQHTERARFVTHQGVDKRHGGLALAQALGVDLAHSIGAGDAETDTFLCASGLAVIVGNGSVDYKGLRDTLRVPDPAAFGEMLMAVADHLA
jgi:hydroxymethylpyrimidine pyrophosphatase-like HAD family hydrolase